MISKYIVSGLLLFSVSSCFNEDDYKLDLTQPDDYISLRPPLEVVLFADGYSNITIGAVLPTEADTLTQVIFECSKAGYFSNGTKVTSVKPSLSVEDGKVLNIATTQVVSTLNVDSIYITARVLNFETSDTIRVKFVSAPPSKIILTASDFTVLPEFEKKVEVVCQLGRASGRASLDQQVIFEAMDLNDKPFGSFQRSTGTIDASGVYKTMFGISQKPSGDSTKLKIRAKSFSDPSLKDSIYLFIPK